MHYMDAKETDGEKAWRQLHKNNCKQFWTSLGGNTSQSGSCMATDIPSRKLSKLDEPDMQDTAREARTSS